MRIADEEGATILVDKVPKKYHELYQCEQFANTLIEILKEKGIHGEYLNVTSSTPFLYSDSLAKPITTNGKHYAVKVGHKVFDNLNPKGILYQEWENDLGGENGLFLKPPHAKIETIPF